MSNERCYQCGEQHENMEEYWAGEWRMVCESCTQAEISGESMCAASCF